MDEHLQLQYFPPEIVDGVKTAVIPREVIRKNVENWRSTVVYYSLGAKLGVLGIKKYTETHWKIKVMPQEVPVTNSTLQNYAFSIIKSMNST